MTPSEQNRLVNIWTARFIPFFTWGCVAYASWVLTKKLCLDYLLRPQPTVFTSTRPSQAIPILVIYYVLLFFMLICHVRLFYVVARYPGRVPSNSKPGKAAAGEKNNGSAHTQDLNNSLAQIEAGNLTVEQFWLRDAFHCNYDGRPKYCSKCRNWKPDRAHHCKELDRCVLRMDHFCPWVGGVVGETSYKFFVQYVFWVFLYCLHLLVSTTYYFTQIYIKFDHAVDVYLATVVGISGFFFLFATAMVGTSLHLVLVNSTTIEQIELTKKKWCFAIHIPEDKLQQVKEVCGDELRLITYPRPPSEMLQLLNEGSIQVPGAMPHNQGSPYFQATTMTGPPPNEPLRVFGIFETRRGKSPWDLGLMENWCELMGFTIWEWFLPIRRSPLTDHRYFDSYYKLGPEIEYMKWKAGILESSQSDSSSPKPRKHHHRHHSTTGGNSA